MVTIIPDAVIDDDMDNMDSEHGEKADEEASEKVSTTNFPSAEKRARKAMKKRRLVLCFIVELENPDIFGTPVDWSN
ncbi:hypothetical protein OROGR_028662 [Orobanche gracilis]